MKKKLRSIEVFKALSTEQLRRATLRASAEDLDFLCGAMTATTVDGELKGISTHLSSTQQAEVMYCLLEAYNTSPPARQQEIVQAVVGAISGYWCSFGEFVVRLINTREWPGVQQVVETSTEKILFSKELLEGMRRMRLYVPPWIELVRQRQMDRDFVDERIYHEERLPALEAELSRAEQALRMRDRDCEVCGAVPEDFDAQESMHQPTIPDGLKQVALLEDGDYRDFAHDLCHMTKTLRRCEACGQLFYHVMDTDMDVCGWSTHEYVYPISEEDGEELKRDARP